jgi:hypothetical protein
MIQESKSSSSPSQTDSWLETWGSCLPRSCTGRRTVASSSSSSTPG